MDRYGFAGVRPVIHMPFGAEGEVLHKDLAALVRMAADTGFPGVVVLGLASEAWTLTDAERRAVLETVAETVADRLPVCVGVDGPTSLAVSRAEQAVAMGADSLMVLPPPAPASSVRDVCTHFRAVADAGGVPVIVQDSPQVTGTALALATLLALTSSHELVRNAKLEAPDAGQMVSALVREGVTIIAGWGGLHYFEAARRGAVGVFAGCDMAPALQQVHQELAAGNWRTAEVAYSQLVPLLAFQARSLELLLLSSKELLRRSGVISSSRLRASTRDLDEVEHGELQRLAEDLRKLSVMGPWLTSRDDRGLAVRPC